MSSIDHSAIAEQLMGEASQSAKSIAKDLFGDVPPGTKKLTRAEFLDFLRRNWQPGQEGLAFRQAQLTRMGADAFLAAAEEAGLIGDVKATLKQMKAEQDGPAV